MPILPAGGLGSRLLFFIRVPSVWPYGTFGTPSMLRDGPAAYDTVLHRYENLECVTVAAVLSWIMTVLHYSLRAVKRSS